MDYLDWVFSEKSKQTAYNNEYICPNDCQWFWFKKGNIIQYPHTHESKYFMNMDMQIKGLHAYHAFYDVQSFFDIQCLEKNHSKIDKYKSDKPGNKYRQFDFGHLPDAVDDEPRAMKNSPYEESPAGSVP